MTITGFYCVNKAKKEKVKRYAKAGFKVALIAALLTLDANTATHAFKLGNIVNVIR